MEALFIFQVYFLFQSNILFRTFHKGCDWNDGQKATAKKELCANKDEKT